MNVLLLVGDVIAEDADSFDLDLDRVAVFGGAWDAGGAGVDDITGFKGHGSGDEVDDGWDVEDEVGGVAFLGGFAVYAYGEVGVEGVYLGVDERAKGAEGVGALGAPPLEVAALPGAATDVVAGGVAKDVVQGVFLRHGLGAAANDDDKFAFVLDEAGVLGENDSALGVQERGEGLEEDAGNLGPLSFAEVAGIVEANGEDFGWFAGCKELYVGEVVSGGGSFDVAVDVTFDFGNGAVVDYAVGCSAVGLESCEFHGCVSGVSWDGVGG